MSKSYRRIQIVVGFLSIAILSSCSTLTQVSPSPSATAGIPNTSTIPTATSEASLIPTDTSIPPTPTPQPVEIIFEVTFDENYNCVVSGPTEVSIGEYLLRLNNQSDRKVDIAVTHLIDGHTFQDLHGLQSEHGEPFVKVYWMSQPNYYTRDHKVWHYTFDEPGEHAIMILQHVHVGMWICESFQVIEAMSEE